MAPEPQAAALRAGVKLAGCTIHVVTHELDDGPIVAQAAVPVPPDYTVESLAERIMVVAHWLYPLVLQLFAQGRVTITDGVARVSPESVP